MKSGFSCYCNNTSTAYQNPYIARKTQFHWARCCRGQVYEGAEFTTPSMPTATAHLHSRWSILYMDHILHLVCSWGWYFWAPHTHVLSLSGSVVPFFRHRDLIVHSLLNFVWLNCRIPQQIRMETLANPTFCSPYAYTYVICVLLVRKSPKRISRTWTLVRSRTYVVQCACATHDQKET